MLKEIAREFIIYVNRLGSSLSSCLCRFYYQFIIGDTVSNIHEKAFLVYMYTLFGTCTYFYVTHTSVT